MTETYEVTLVPVYVTPRTSMRYTPPYPKRLIHRDMKAVQKTQVKVPGENKIEVAFDGARSTRYYIEIEAYIDGKKIAIARLHGNCADDHGIMLAPIDSVRIDVQYEDFRLEVNDD